MLILKRKKLLQKNSNVIRHCCQSKSRLKTVWFHRTSVCAVNVIHTTRVLRLNDHHVLLPNGLLPSIFPSKIRRRRSFLHLFRIAYLKYWSFLHLTVVNSSFPILRNTIIFVIFSIHDIFKILLYVDGKNVIFRCGIDQKGGNRLRITASLLIHNLLLLKIIQSPSGGERG